MSGTVAGFGGATVLDFIERDTWLNDSSVTISAKVAIIAPRDEHASETTQALP